MKRRFSAILLMALFAALFACKKSETPTSVEGVVMNKLTISMLVGAKEPLSAVVKPAEAENKAVAWSTSNAAIATVSAAGEVTAVAEGTATITVTTKDGAKTASCVVTVSKAAVLVTGVTLDKTATEVSAGATATLVATVAPAEATNKTVAWSTSSAAIATVSDQGVVTGVAGGTATITVKATDGSNKAATCEVTVTVNSVRIGGLNWAIGNLVSTSDTPAGVAAGTGVKIGAPIDGGLYFQFGSLIGYKGGAAANNGTGAGTPATNLISEGWGGNAWSWGNDAMVYPAALVGTPAVWPLNTVGTDHKWFFSGIGVTTGEITTDIPNGVGDPCTYYLGGTWRLPTNAEHSSLASDVANKGPWIETPVPGRWLGVDPGNASSSVFFPGSGFRENSSGVFRGVNTAGYSWSSSIESDTNGYNLRFYFSGSPEPQGDSDRSTGFPVRCVRPV